MACHTRGPDPGSEGRAPYEDCPPPKREKLLQKIRKSRVSYAINIRTLRQDYGKDDAAALTRAELRVLRQALREAVRYYQIAHEKGFSTPTDRRKRLRTIRTAASRLLDAPCDAASAARLAGALGSCDNCDPDLFKRLSNIVRSGTGAKFGQLPPLKGELEALWALRCCAGAAQRVGQFAAEWLGHVRILATLDIDDIVPGRAKFPDPALPGLIHAVAPIWTRVTGRSVMPTNATEGKVYKFAEWLGKVARQAGLRMPPIPSVRLAAGAWRRKNTHPIRRAADPIGLPSTPADGERRQNGNLSSREGRPEAISDFRATT